MTTRDDTIARLAATTSPEDIADDLLAGFDGAGSIPTARQIALALRAYGEREREGALSLIATLLRDRKDATSEWASGYRTALEDALAAIRSLT